MSDLNNSVLQIFVGDINWTALCAMATWCFLGCAEDRDYLYPARRLGAVISSAVQDFNATFPKNMNGVDTVRHLDKRFKTVSFLESIAKSSCKLRGFQKRAEANLRQIKDREGLHRDCLDLFAGVLDSRDMMIELFSKEPESYIQSSSFAQNVGAWPQCPINLQFLHAGVAVAKSQFKNPEKLRFNTYSTFDKQDENMVGRCYSN